MGDARLKICHVITRMILGGAMENTLLTAEGLYARGHEVTLITGPALGSEGELMTRATAGGYRVIVVDSLRRAIHPLGDLRAYRSILAHLREIRPDIMHSHASKAGILARKAAAKVGGIRIVHTVHGLSFHPYQSWWLNRLYIAMERLSARRTDALISVAGAMTAQALAAGVGRPGQFTTIYSGMEVERYVRRPEGVEAFRAGLKLGGDEVLVTQVSRLAALKGHEFILGAAERLQDPRIHFCFVGDGAWRARIEADVARRNLSARVHLTGLVPPEQIPLVMHASDIVVHCSLREGLPRSLPQAMLAGKPVISFDLDGAPEVVDSRTGVLLAPKDVAGLKLAIGTLASSRDLREKLGRGGRQRCREMFDHEKMVDRIEAVYRRVVQ